MKRYIDTRNFNCKKHVDGFYYNADKFMCLFTNETIEFLYKPYGVWPLNQFIYDFRIKIKSYGYHGHLIVHPISPGSIVMEVHSTWTYSASLFLS